MKGPKHRTIKTKSFKGKRHAHHVLGPMKIDFFTVRKQTFGFFLVLGIVTCLRIHSRARGAIIPLHVFSYLNGSSQL